MSDAAEQPAQLLRSVELRRFKAAYATGAIDLQPFTVLIGRNGSGKSTLLEALQWIDTALRSNTYVACERYAPIADIINLRAETRQSFRLRLTWWDQPDAEPWTYTLKVGTPDGISATVENEELMRGRTSAARYAIRTTGQQRQYHSEGTWLPVSAPEKLALGELPRHKEQGFLHDFWQRAVFLRLSPKRLTEGSRPVRLSSDPLLDEEGLLLPALLKELSADQREDLTALLTNVLTDIRGIDLKEQETGRETRINFALRELMPYRGRGGRSEFSVPAWMLSEGTRRITAIFALLVHDPPPSLLCIEEIENGLDPWTILFVLRALQDAVARGVQVIVTTHSPWLLDHVELTSIIHVRREQGATVYERFADRAAVQSYAADIPPGTRFVNEVG
jgi:predicted ATPase